MIEDLIAFQKVEDLTILLNVTLSKIPKNEQFVLAQNIKNELYHIVRLIIHLNNLKSNKQEHQLELCEEFDFLFYLVRIAYKSKYIPMKQYENISTKINEIIKICYG